MKNQISYAEFDNINTFQTIVSNIVSVVIFGANLGSSQDDVISVQLKDNVYSDTIIWISPSIVKAIFHNVDDLEYNYEPTTTSSLKAPTTTTEFSPNDVTIVTKSGSTKGPHLQPLTIIRANSGNVIKIFYTLHK